MAKGIFRIVKETKGTGMPIFHIEEYREIKPVPGCFNWSREDSHGTQYGASADLDFVKKRLKFIKEGDLKPVIEVVYSDIEEWGDF